MSKVHPANFIFVIKTYKNKTYICYIKNLNITAGETSNKNKSDTT